MKRLSASIVSVVWIILICPVYSYADTTAYFPNFGSDNVKRVFADDDTTFRTVALVGCDGPYGAAVTPDGANLMITCQDSNNFIVIPTVNLDTESAQTAISLGEAHQPRGVAVETRGLLAYVANYEQDTVSVININSRQVVGDPIDVGAGPWGIAAIYDSEEATPLVYVTSATDGTVSKIDNDEVVDTSIRVGRQLRGVALTPDGDFLYVANFEDDEVVVMDTGDLSVVAEIRVGDGPWGIAMASQGDYVFVTNSNSDSTSVITTSTRSVSDTVEVEDKPMGVAAPINADYAYVVNQGANTISKVTTSGESSTFGEDELDGAFSLGVFIGGSPPEAPTELEATMDSSSRIILNWTDNANDELGYKIERRKDTDEDEEFIEVAAVDEDETTYTDSGLSRGTTYEYRLRSFNEAAFSDYSASASATTSDEQFSWCFIHTLLY